MSDSTVVAISAGLTPPPVANLTGLLLRVTTLSKRAGGMPWASQACLEPRLVAAPESQHLSMTKVSSSWLASDSAATGDAAIAGAAAGLAGFVI